MIDESEFSASQHLGGGYFGYAAVGLGLLEIVLAGLGSFARKLRDEQTTGTFEALMATPAHPSLIILSSAAYDMLRATFDGLVMIAAAVVIFGLDLDLGAGPVAVAAVTLARLDRALCLAGCRRRRAHRPLPEDDRAAGPGRDGPGAPGRGLLSDRGDARADRVDRKGFAIHLGPRRPASRTPWRRCGSVTGDWAVRVSGGAAPPGTAWVQGFGLACPPDRNPGPVLMASREVTLQRCDVCIRPTCGRRGGLCAQRAARVDCSPREVSMLPSHLLLRLTSPQVPSEEFTRRSAEPAIAAWSGQSSSKRGRRRTAVIAT